MSSLLEKFGWPKKEESTEPEVRPEPEVVGLIRPILIDALRDSEPGTPNFELASFLHDQLEAYLLEQTSGEEPDGDRSST